MVKAEMLRDWQDGLHDFYEDEIREGFKRHMADNPKIRPNVGYIRKHIMAMRAAHKLPDQQEPDVIPIATPEAKARASAILKKAGYGFNVKTKGQDMTGYGHKAIAGEIGGMPFRMDTWGAGPFVFLIDGKRVLFEDSDMFGPSVLRFTDHHPKARQPGSRNRFWDAYCMWRKAGRPVKMKKIALWKEPQDGSQGPRQRNT